MRLLEGQNQRESWLATNKTQKVITISDLPQVPAFSPGETHDLLRYCSRDKVLNSKVLEALVRRDWIGLVKKNEDFPPIVVTAANVSEALSAVERDTAVTAEPTEPGATSLDELTDVQIDSPQGGQILIYDGENWVNEDNSGGSTLNDFPVTILTAFDTTAPKATEDADTSIAAGALCVLRSDAVPPSVTAKLIGLIVTGSVPFKAELKKVIEGVSQIPSARWFADNGSWYFVPPAKNMFPVSGSNTGMFNGFEVVVTNLDTSAAADFYAHFYYDEE